MRVFCLLLLAGFASSLFAAIPSVTIDQASAQADPTSNSPIAFTVVFSESVSGFTGSDVLFSGSTVGGTLMATLSGSGANYTVSVSGMVGSGTVVANIPAGVCVSLSTTQGNTASASSDNHVMFNDLAPSVNIDQAGGQVDPTANTPIQFTVTFSEVVTGFTSADVSFAGSTVGGTLVAVVTGTGPAYTVSVSGMVGNGTVVASVVAAGALDAAGQPNAASSSTDNQVTYNDPAPAVTVDQSGPQIDPTTVSPIQFTVVFSEGVTGFTNGDVSFAGSTAGGTLTASIQGSGPTYTVSVSGMTTHGNVVVSIPAGAVLDLFNQPNASSTSSDNSVAWIGQPASGKSDDSNDDEDCSTGVNSGPWALLVFVAAVSLGLRRRKA